MSSRTFKRMWPTRVWRKFRNTSNDEKPDKFIRVQWGLFWIILMLFSILRFFLKINIERKRECECTGLDKCFTTQLKIRWGFKSCMFNAVFHLYEICPENKDQHSIYLLTLPGMSFPIFPLSYGPHTVPSPWVARRKWWRQLKDIFSRQQIFMMQTYWNLSHDTVPQASWELCRKII
jgi:hypothetical protein